MNRQLILFLIFLFLNSCYNPYMRINRSAETLSPSQRCTDPILKEVEMRTAGIYILSRFQGGEKGQILKDKNNFVLMDMRQKFPEDWITSFEQGTLLTIPAEAIFYKSDRRKLSDIGAERLSQLSALLAEYPETSFIIEGHHANQTSWKKNLRTAFKQAKGVARFLRKRNIEQQRFEVISYGCQQRLEERGAKNNRIEIAISTR